MQIDDKKIVEILLEEGYVEKGDMDRAKKSAEEEGGAVFNYLFSEGIITKELFGQAIAEYYKVPFVDFNNVKIDESVFELIPELVARSRNFIAFARDEKGVKVGMADPYDMEMISLIEKKVGHKIIPYYALLSDIKDALDKYKANLKEDFKKVLAELKNKNLSREEQDETIVNMVDLMLQGGFRNKASDIHIEPYAKKIIVRFRIDGVMHDALEIPKNLAELVLSRLKVMSRMRTDEHQKAQDGKFRFNVGSETIDVRVSIVPVTQGENVVMRLLSSSNRRFGLADLGLNNNNLEILRKAMKNPHGMILVTGPTGSGKTTTLYAVINILNKRNIHIATIEDPVEYDIESVTQIQVNPKTNLTFAKGLRALVRQDPDIIMVGEIRDEETADIAVNSAMTGHLVLSTLHTNDAATAIPRFLDMGVEPFLIASTVNVVIAQRLVREICSKCRISYQPTREESLIIEGNPGAKAIFKAKGGKDFSKLRLYKGAGCKICGQTGYSGRIGIFEILEMTEDIKKLVVSRASSDDIMNVAVKKNKMTTMLEDGIEKVLAGETTMEEVLRVTI